MIEYGGKYLNTGMKGNFHFLSFGCNLQRVQDELKMYLTVVTTI